MKPKAPSKPKNGFALVVTISMMVLLTIVVVATLSLSIVTLRTATQDSAQAVARANARLALMLAIGQLQKEAGPDQRVTANASIEENNKQNPQWMGVWRTGPKEKDSKPTWIISGANPDPGVSLTDANSAVLSKSPASDPTRQELRAPYVKVEGAGQVNGRYAYWVGDEGQKVRVDVANPDERGRDLGFRERVGRSQSPSEPGFAAFDSKHKDMWAGFDSDYAGSVDRKTLVSMGEVSIAAKSSGDLKRADIPNYYFNDLTTGGFGLPVNVRDGGMKRDLSLIFDTTQQGKPFVANLLGATPSKASSADQGYVAGTTVYKFGISDRAKFGLSDSITSNYTKAFVGPNWGTLFNYGRLWETVHNNSTPMVGLLPRVDSDLRQPNWLPYAEARKGIEFQQDVQHTNSGMSPVISVAQVGFSIMSVITGNGPPPAKLPLYSINVVVKPVVGLWNPYNVHIDSAPYQLEWALAPALKFITNVPDNTPDTAPKQFIIFLRQYWGVNGGVFPSGGNQDGSYMRMQIGGADFQPGEFRLFSPIGLAVMDGSANGANGTHQLSPNLEINGGYLVPVYVDPKQTTKVKLQYPSGTLFTFTDLDMQDTHPGLFLDAGKSRFGNLDLNAANTWCTLKAGTGYTTHLNRWTDFWNGGKGGIAKGALIPEPINTNTPKNQYAVNSFTSPRHIGTWRFYSRNPTEVVDANQGCRGWIDSNPRVMSSNFRFDGSKNDSNGLQGWNVSSHWIAGEGSKSFGDGQGGNRGLVAEDVSGLRFPEGPTTKDRWQGLGGPASTNAGGGLTNVIIYDVPQAPLTSLGQFQHANLSRYNFEPGFVVGNSYANCRIPLDKTVAGNFGGMGFNAVDISYEVNNRLWDSFFFSTMSPDYKGGVSSSFDKSFDYNALVLRRKSLPNPRMIFSPVTGDTSIDGIISKAGSAAPQTIATRIMIEGAFNVNSTSKTAWKAVLSTMDGSELPYINPTNWNVAEPPWVTPKGIRFSRFNHPILPQGYAGGGRQAAFWQGWRELDDKQLDDLAEAIVTEVKDRGPFRSMADFVNRDPNGKPAHQLKGALQAAIDNTINSSIPADIGEPAGNPPGAIFSKAITGENQSAGHACYLLQGDILQCLAPIMTVRSDYFRIRTCGEALDKNNNVIARAWCEAFIQRMPEYVDSADSPELPLNPPTPTKTGGDELNSEINKTFGRRMQMVSFRWLNPEEL